ncbi:hypothetical protein Taro_013448 [Colocasia esculenta]|uniref:Uncharacterized protein n=1 Tax=Colocasia esculenta TaxID=4460 RepID=A0A843UG77_COLES|nr:hypothetical protein [Colocasia esculenta]
MNKDKLEESLRTRPEEDAGVTAGSECVVLLKLHQTFHLFLLFSSSPSSPSAVPRTLLDLPNLQPPSYLSPLERDTERERDVPSQVDPNLPLRHAGRVLRAAEPQNQAGRRRRGDCRVRGRIDKNPAGRGTPPFQDPICCAVGVLDLRGHGERALPLEAPGGFASPIYLEEELLIRTKAGVKGEEAFLSWSSSSFLLFFPRELRGGTKKWRLFCVVRMGFTGACPQIAIFFCLQRLPVLSIWVSSCSIHLGFFPDALVHPLWANLVVDQEDLPSSSATVFYMGYIG